MANFRNEMIPPRPAPLAQSGGLRWLKDNLFSSWGNVILSVLIVWFVVTVVHHVAPWMLRGIWNASSLAECRAARDALYPEGTSAACWAVIGERWNQLVFGFYPQNAYWRPILGFALFLLAVSPVLFAGLPRKMLWLSAAAPFVIYYLIWGGSVWLPLSVAICFALIAFVGFVLGRKGALWGVIAGLVVFVLCFFGPVQGWISGLGEAIWPASLPFVQSKDIGGFTLSLIIGISGITLSLPLGILLALGRRSDMFLIHTLSVGFIEIIRGVPLIVWLFTASLLLNYFLPPGSRFDLMLRVIIMVTLFASAYMAEVVRGGLAAIPKGQFEAADAMGLTYWRAMRLVILPQALKISIPGIVNTFIGLFKDTTLVVFIGMMDPINLINAIRANNSWNGIYWELFIFVGALFFIICFAMSRYSIYLEKRLRREHR